MSVMRIKLARDWSAGRKVLMFLFIAVLAAAIYFGVSTYSQSAGLEKARLHHLIDIPIDLSCPGITEGVVNETFLNAHGAALMISVADANANDDPTMLFEGLDCTVLLRDGYHDSPESIRVENCSMGKDGSIRFWSYHPAAKGDYPLQIEVRKPATALAGRSQRLIGQYELCGLESLPVLIGLATTTVAGLAAVALGYFTFRQRRAKP